MYYAAQDVFQYLLSSTGGGAQDSEHLALREATHHAYRDLVNARDWNWHVTDTTLTNDPLGGGDGLTTFTLPANVRNVDGLSQGARLTPCVYVSPAEWQRLHTYPAADSGPIYWTLFKDNVLPDRWQVRMASKPPSGTLYYTYRRSPQPIRYMGYEQICRATGFSVNGAVRRYGTAATFPDGLSGLHPYTAQEIIGVAGSMIGTPATNAKTAVSDYLDISGSMFTPLLSGAEAWLARLTGKNVEGAMAVYQRDMRLAMEADAVAPMSGRRGLGGFHSGTPRSLGYYSASGPDTGV